jgi:hypothetical protein
MARVVVGSVPDKIAYVFSDEKLVTVGCKWDINWYNESDKPATTKENVLPTFPVDASDENMISKAKTRAAGRYQKSTKTTQIVVVENKPITNVKVLSLEYRGQGGRAYKAVIDKYYVDLREDVLMDVLLKAGVNAGGILQGEYIWAKIGSQMKLIRIGSELHRLVVEFGSKKDIKPVRKNELEVGGVYQTRKKEKAIFLGYVNSTLYKRKTKPPSGYSSYYVSYEQTTYKPSFDYETSKVKKSMLFYRCYDHEGLEKSLEKMKTKPLDGFYYDFHIVKSHKYIEKLDQLELPENMINMLREKVATGIKNKVVEYAGFKAPDGQPQRTPSVSMTTLEGDIEYLSEYLNLYEFGSEPIEPFDIKKYLAFI